MGEKKGSGRLSSLLAERAPSEGPRSMRAVNDSPTTPVLKRREEQSAQFWIQSGRPYERGDMSKE